MVSRHKDVNSSRYVDAFYIVLKPMEYQLGWCEIFKTNFKQKRFIIDTSIKRMKLFNMFT